MNVRFFNFQQHSQWHLQRHYTLKHASIKVDHTTVRYISSELKNCSKREITTVIKIMRKKYGKRFSLTTEKTSYLFFY